MHEEDTVTYVEMLGGVPTIRGERKNESDRKKQLRVRQMEGE